MLAFHNEHIASCAFLTYFTPDSTTASTSPTALTTTAAAASILNDKQALTGILLKAKNMTNLTQRKRPYISRVPVSTMALMNSLPCWFQGNKTNSKDSLTPVLIDLSKTHTNVIRQHHRERCEAAAHLCDFSLNNTTLNTTLNKRNNINKQHQCSSDNLNKTSVSKL